MAGSEGESGFSRPTGPGSPPGPCAPTARRRHFALGARIGVLMTFAPSVRKTSSKEGENFESRSRTTNRTSSSRWAMARLRACWVTQAESGFPRMCTRRGPELDGERHVQGAEEGRLHGKEVKGQDPPCLGSEELAPRGPAAPGSRPETGAPKDRPDRGRPDADAEHSELPLDPDASPPGVLPAEPQDKLSDLGVDRRPALTAPTIGPLAPHELPVPANKRLGGDQERGPPIPGKKVPGGGEEHLVDASKPWQPLGLPPEHDQLVAQHHVLHLELRRG